MAHDTDQHLHANHAAVLHAWARALDAIEDHDHAVHVFSDAIAVCRALPGDEARDELAGVLVNVAVCAIARADHDTALDLAVESVNIHRELADQDAANGVELVEARKWPLAIAACAIVIGIRFGPAWGAVCFGLVWLSPWPRWLLAKVVVAMRGQLPLWLMTFLDDARARGVLRASGPNYRFAHYLLQENLAQPGTRR